jgi:NADPH:quinone reductase-like Zn-dependent oxidoreductase
VRALAPDGIDRALDIAGSGVIPELIELTGEPSRVLSIADFSAPEQGAQVSTSSTNTAGALAEAARLFTEGAFGIPVEKTFPLADAAEAQRASEAGHVTGKFVVTVP